MIKSTCLSTCRGCSWSSIRFRSLSWPNSMSTFFVKSQQDDYARSWIGPWILSNLK